MLGRVRNFWESIRTHRRVDLRSLSGKEREVVSEVRRLSRRGGFFHNHRIAANLHVFDVVPPRENLKFAAPVISEYPYELYHRIRELLPSSLAGLELLEIGPGDGYGSVSFAKEGAHLTIVEPSELFLQRIQLFLRFHNVMDKVTLIHSPYHKETLQDRKFDAVVCAGVLYHLHESETGVQDYLSIFCEKLASQSDYLVIETVCREGTDDTTPFLDRENSEARYGRKRFDVNTLWLRRFFEEAGFSSQTVDRYDPDKIRHLENRDYYPHRKIFLFKRTRH